MLTSDVTLDFSLPLVYPHLLCLGQIRNNLVDGATTVWCDLIRIVSAFADHCVATPRIRRVRLQDARPASAPTIVQQPPVTIPVQALDTLAGGPEKWTSPESLASSLQIMLLLTVLSLAPAILLMTTCYVRIIVVLGLLRQAIGLQSLPPSQVMTSIALFMTLFVMTPVWTQVYDDAIKPYTDPTIEMSLEEAYEAGSIPIREFMARQIDVAENADDVLLFYDYMDKDAPIPSGYEDVPMRVLLPAYILSELKTAFLMGFQIYLPFLDCRLGCRQCHDLDGDVDVAATSHFAAVQTVAVCAWSTAGIWSCER